MKKYKKILIKKREFSCKDINRLMPEFLDDSLDGTNLKKFMMHAQVCENCTEEMNVQFLIHEGLKQLEKDDTYFNLQKKLEDRLNEVRARIRIRDRLVTFMSVVVAISGIGVLIMTMLVIAKFL